MRTASLLALFASATLSGAAFAAPPAVAPAASNAAVLSVQTIAGHLPTLRASDVGDLVGVYRLPDGQTMRISFEQRRLFAELGERKTELAPVGPNTFAARDDALRLVFSELPFASDVTLSSK